MKNYILIAFTAVLMSACNQAELERAQNEKVKQRDSLVSIVNEREAAISEFIASFNEVERNLDSVAVKQHVLTISAAQQGEVKSNQRTRINAGIAAINNLMDENRKKLAQLQRKMKNSSHKNAELEKAIVILNNQLAQKDLELIALNEKLNNLSVQVTDLQTSLNSSKIPDVHALYSYYILF